MSDVIVPFLYELRAKKLKVGTTEIIQLSRALRHELHDSSLDGFYYVARSLMVHREEDYDLFDQAFAAHFRGIPDTTISLLKELEEWLKDPVAMRELSQADRDAMQSLDMEEVRKLLAERMAEQRERHDGGNRWVGTGGTSPFGTGGENPAGVRLGKGGGRSGSQAAQGALAPEIANGQD